MQPGEDFGAVEFDELRALRPALVGEQLELEPLGRPDEHHHHAGVGGSHEGVLGRENACIAVGVGRGREIHLRAVPHDQVAPVLAFPMDGRVVGCGSTHYPFNSCSACDRIAER